MDKYIEQIKLSKDCNVPIITLRHWRKYGVKINGVVFPLASKKAGSRVFIKSEHWYNIPTWFRLSYKNRQFKNFKK